MAIIAMADNGLEDITAKMDGALYNVLIGNKDVVLGGIGSEFNLSYSASSLSISVGTGLALVGGRHFLNDAVVNLSMPASSTRYLAAKIDLSQAAGSEGSLALVIALTEDDLNNTGSVRMKALYQITSSASGIFNVIDMRDVTTAGVSGADVTNLQTQITNIVNSLGDQADFILDGNVLTIKIY